MVRLACAACGACRSVGWPYGDTVGRCLLLDDVMDVALGASEKGRVVVVAVASLWHLLTPVVGRESALVRVRIPDLLAMVKGPLFVGR